MANMSYCRFENTLRDLMDCLNAIEEAGLGVIESECEREAAEDLVYTAEQFIAAYKSAKEVDASVRAEAEGEEADESECREA